MKKLRAILMASFLSLLIIGGLVLMETRGLRKYDRAYEKYGIEERSQLSKAEAGNLMDESLGYVLGGEISRLVENSYSYYELIHLEDVRTTYRILKRLMALSAFLMLILIIPSRGKDLAAIGQGLVYNYSLLGGILVLGFINFRQVFLAFHSLVFNNDYWLLDSSKDLLIQLMPEALFMDLLVKVIVKYFLIAISIQIIIYLLDKKRKEGYN